MNRRFIRIARNDERVCDIVLQQQVISAVYGVLRLYWDRLASNDEVQAYRQSLAAADTLRADNRAGVEAGPVAPVKVTRAQHQVGVTTSYHVILTERDLAQVPCR